MAMRLARRLPRIAFHCLRVSLAAQFEAVGKGQAYGYTAISENSHGDFFRPHLHRCGRLIS